MIDEFQQICTLCRTEELPASYSVPNRREMTQDGKLRCDHSSDVEHVMVDEETDGRFATSVIWTSDGGAGVFEHLIGCQWIGRIERENPHAGRWDEPWTALVEVVLDCPIDTDAEVAIAYMLELLDAACHLGHEDMRPRYLA